MPFQPGNRANPGGRSSNKEFKRALMLALKEADGEHTKLRKVADSLVKAAISGDVRAAGLIADRIDGKPEQRVVGDEDQPIQIAIRRVIIDPKNDDSD